MAKGESGFTKAGKSQNNGYAPGDSPYQSMLREARQVIRDAEIGRASCRERV